MHKILSVDVSFFVVIDVIAKPIAQNAPANISGFIVKKSGLTTIKIPTNPRKITNILGLVNFSFRNKGARIATQIGVENSKAKSWESGI